MKALLINDAQVTCVTYRNIRVKQSTPDFLFVSAGSPTPNESVHGLNWRKRY